LLKSRRGKTSNQRPATLDDALEFARDKLYLEIDFKSSANELQVIDKLKDAGLTNHVILISYNRKQRDRFKKFAPEMLRSAGPSYANKDDLVWVGKDITHANTNFDNSQRVIGSISKPEHVKTIGLAKSRAQILVTDDANRYLPITGLTAASKKVYMACLSK